MPRNDDAKTKLSLARKIYKVTKQIHRQFGKNFGDIVEVVLQERDTMNISMWKCPKCGREFKKNGQSHFCGEKPNTIDEYILSQDEDKQEDLQHIRQILHKALPEAKNVSHGVCRLIGKSTIFFILPLQKNTLDCIRDRSRNTFCTRASVLQNRQRDYPYPLWQD